MFSKLFSKDPRNHKAFATYTSMMAQSRQEVFFANWGVDDTLEGRFEILALHLALYLIRLKRETGEKEQEFSQTLFDLTFLEIDRALREMGVGDASIAKKMKKFVRNFYGRLEAYQAALQSDAPHSALSEALQRNVYDNNQDQEAPSALIQYINNTHQSLEKTDFKTIYKNGFQYPNVHKEAA